MDQNLGARLVRAISRGLRLNAHSSRTREKFLQLQALQVSCTTRAPKIASTSKLTLQAESCSPSAEELLCGQSSTGT